ncbi:glycosyltransferase family 4 protein [Brevibacterium sp. CFH 10365]|uniref:glycosyltransferase family 4 protein n=1 Tax=Brevibacterium sp. CFH 10365 TaxID=2585207 RepID=UPI0018791856|nr:glycosyltransferase [Brevibacterium sp. CFH 10365]
MATWQSTACATVRICEELVTSEVVERDFDPLWYQSAYPDVRALGMEPHEHYQKYGKMMGRKPVPDVRALRRLIFVVPDISTIGGMASRTRTTLSHGQSRSVEYCAITARSANGGRQAGEYCYATDPVEFERALNAWLPTDTAMVISNNAIRSFPIAVRERIQQFPIIYISAGQLAFMLQDSKVLKDREYVRDFRAMRIMSFSEGDINFQRQLGIHGQVRGFAPVKQRALNMYDVSKNVRIGYVGRIDFHAKDCAKLLDVAQSLRERSWGPIRVYTTDGRNSPDYSRFRLMIEEQGLEDQFEIVLNETDKTVIYQDLALLVVPSKKESFGNVVVESMSFGVPVIAASYAPGPAEIIEDGRSGWLLDEFTGSNVVALIDALTPERLHRASVCAFERHKHYRVEAHVEQIEELARGAVESFTGVNTLPVFPYMKVLDG